MRAGLLLQRLEPAAPWLALALAVAFFVQGFLGIREKSLTWDEPFHISGGYAILTWGEFEIFGASPPLMQQLEALPLLSLDLAVPGRFDPRWRQSAHPPTSFGRMLLYRMGNDVQTIALRARLPVLLIGSALVVGIYGWGRRLYGEGPALTAAALAAFSPNLLAHAKIAATDLGCTAAMFAAVWGFWRACERDRARDWLLCGVLAGLALLAKYTALLLGPIFIGLALHWWWSRRDHMGIGAVFRAAALASLGAALTVGAGFNLGFDLSLYVKGVQMIYADHVENYAYYLLGRVSEEPLWYYHIVAFFLKVPLSTLLLLGLSAASLRRGSAGRTALPYTLVPVFVVVLASCFDRENVGMRRILPVFPFLFLFCAQAARAWPRGWQAALVLALVSLSAFESLRIHPHHLSYVSAAVGGPERGPYLLDESNIDWGQDLPALARWQQGRPADERVRLLYFGSADPEAYGVRSDPFDPLDRVAPRPGLYAISAHQLVGFRKLRARGHGAVDWLSAYRPIATAGYSIYIYEFPQSAPES